MQQTCTCCGNRIWIEPGPNPNTVDVCVIHANIPLQFRETRITLGRGDAERLVDSIAEALGR